MTVPRGQHPPLDEARAQIERAEVVRQVVRESQPPTPIVEFMALFPEFQATSWDGWRTILARLTPTVREFFAIVGRGAGKSRIVALLACVFASREYRRVSGENIYIGIFAPDRKQAGVTFRYVLGLLRSVPSLAALVANDTKDSIELTNGIIIEVISASVAAVRGRTYALVIVEEAAFLPQDQSANPDAELLRSVRPALARCPGSLLCVVSSPYARRGVLWHAWQKYHGQPDGAIVFVQAATLDLNPTFDRAEIARAYEDDPASAGAEYGGIFRGDVETFVSVEAVNACVMPDRREVPPTTAHRYVAFVDPSGGSVDSFTLAIGHAEPREQQPIVVLDCVRETRPPFSPESVTKDYAALLKTYGLVVVTGDRYAGEWPRERFREHGISYELSDRPASDIFRDALPLINSARLELLDHPRLLTQLGTLERRTARSGRDAIGHPPGAHDDVAVVACGVAVELASKPVIPAGENVSHSSSNWDPYGTVVAPRQTYAEIEMETQAWLQVRERVRQGTYVPEPSPTSAEWSPYDEER